jgi:hypothetical protein
MKVPAMFTYPSLLGRAVPDLEDCAGLVAPAKGSALKKSIYVIGLVVLGGALIIQSFWG